MAMQVVVHVHNEDPFLADLEALPDPHSNYIRVTNPRKRDGKTISTLTNGATSSTPGRGSPSSKSWKKANPRRAPIS